MYQLIYEHWPDPLTAFIAAAIPGVTTSFGGIGLALTPAFATTAAVAGGLGLTTAGILQAGQAAASEAESQAAVAEYNAKIQEREAEAIEQQAQYAQRKQAEEAARYASTLRAEFGASGVVSSEGTPLLIQSRQAAESELENLMIGYQGQRGVQRALSQAVLDRAQARLYKQRGRSARTAGYVGAGTTLLTGFGELGMKLS